MNTRILAILSRRVGDMPLSDAMELAAEIESVTPGNFSSEGEEPLSVIMIRAATWAERNFSVDNVSNRKIACIKILRNQFGLGLRQAKDILDNTFGSARSDWEF